MRVYLVPLLILIYMTKYFIIFYNKTTELICVDYEIYNPYPHNSGLIRSIDDGFWGKFKLKNYIMV